MRLSSPTHHIGPQTGREFAVNRRGSFLPGERSCLWENLVLLHETSRLKSRCDSRAGGGRLPSASTEATRLQTHRQRRRTIESWRRPPFHPNARSPVERQGAQRCPIKSVDGPNGFRLH